MTLKRSFRKIFSVTVKILYTYACIMQAESIIYPPRAIYLASCRSVRLFNSKFGRRWICLIRLCLVLKDLKAIGIEKRGHRKKLLFAIEKLPLVDIAQEVPVGDPFNFETQLVWPSHPLSIRRYHRQNQRPAPRVCVFILGIFCFFDNKM